MQHMLGDGRDLRLFAGKIIAAIGPSCAEELNKYNLTPDLIPAVHDTKHLVEALSAQLTSGVIWHPCAEESDWSGVERLQQNGLTPVSLPLYRQEARSAVMRLTGETVDAVCLSSPSAVRRYLKHMNHDDHQALIVDKVSFFAIGQATKRLMEEHHIPVSQVAAESTTDSLLDTVCAYFAPGTSI